MATTYDLSQLVGWTRRRSGDLLRRQQELLISDGTKRVNLSGSDQIQIIEVEVDDEVVASSTYELVGSTLVFDPALADGSEVYATYRQSRYADAEIVTFLEDAAKVVNSDLGTSWVVDVGAGLIQDDLDQMLNRAGAIDDTIEKLIVLNAALSIAQEKSSSAADDAILIKDGDTTIDTSKGAGSADKRMESIRKDYADNLRYARSVRFKGEAGKL